MSKRCISSKPTETERSLCCRNISAELSAEEAAYLYQEQVNTLEALPAPNEKAIQAVLDRESDPKIRSISIADVIDATFFKDIEKSGLIEQLYKGKDRR